MPNQTTSPPGPMRFHMPAKRRYIIAMERARHGQPATGNPIKPLGGGVISNSNPATAWKEPPADITVNPQVANLDFSEPFGVASGITGRDRATRYCEIVISFNWRMHGTGPLSMFALLGQASTGAADRVAQYRIGGNPTGQYLHHGRGGVKGDRCPSFTIWIDIGDGTWMMFPFATVTQLRMTWNPTTTLMGEVTFNSWYPIRHVDKHHVPVAYHAPPNDRTKNLNLIGTGADGLKAHDRLSSVRTLSQQASRAAIYSVTGGRYKVPVISGELTFSRPMEVIYAGNYRPQNVDGETENDALAPFDFAPGDLAMTGQVVHVLDSIKSPSIFDDYLNFSRVGSAGKKNTLKWTDANTNSIQIHSYPWKIDTSVPDASGSAMKLTSTFTGYNDLSAAVDETTPHLTILEPKLKNFENVRLVW